MDMIKKVIKKILGQNKFDSVNYWEQRYANGGNSGDGSYGRLSLFKAEFINNFIKEKRINSATEMGCGDGHQLSIIDYPEYIGLDVSKTIIDHCRDKFMEDKSKRFEVYNPIDFVPIDSLRSDLALSLDVIYHIIEERKYLKHLEDLFGLGKKYVLIYSTNFNLNETQHVLHRKFTDDLKHFKDWEFIKEFKNPFSGIGEQESQANFYLYKKLD
jgi:hypothetical protein